MLLTSARLALRELVLSDLDFVAEMLTDPVVMRYYPKPLTRVEAQAWIERQRARYARDGHGLWLVSDQDCTPRTGARATRQRPRSRCETTPSASLPRPA